MHLRKPFWRWTSHHSRGNGVELMAVYKRKYNSGTVLWYFKFQPPGAARGVLPIRQFGFATKREAEDAEANRRTQEQKKHELAKAGSGVAAAPPKTLSMLLEEFFVQHVEKKLAPKTIERYHEQAACLNPELLAMPLADITPLHLNREWNRLLERGGRARRDKTPRPLSAKSVRSIAGVVSSAFLRAVKWGLVGVNPVSNSEPPVPKKHHGMALLPNEQILMIESATGPWCLPMFLELSAATGARRGEMLALRWSDIDSGDVVISRSLTQTRTTLEFKGTKTERPRRINLPGSVRIPLEVHRQRQDEFRLQFGPDYRAELDLIFANPDGTPLRPDSISASVSLLCRRLGLPKGASLHTLRHSHGSTLLADGVDLATVSERLGHSSVRVTADIYSHALRGRDQDAARRWDEFMHRNGGSRGTELKVRAN
jgi:integrase